MRREKVNFVRNMVDLEKKKIPMKLMAKKKNFPKKNVSKKIQKKKNDINHNWNHFFYFLNLKLFVKTEALAQALYMHFFASLV